MFAAHNISGSMKSWRDKQPWRWEKPWMLCALLLLLVCCPCHGPGNWLIPLHYRGPEFDLWAISEECLVGKVALGLSFFWVLHFLWCNIFIFTHTIFAVIQYFIVTLFHILYYIPIQIEIVKGRSIVLRIETFKGLIHKPLAFCNLITDNIAN